MGLIVRWTAPGVTEVIDYPEPELGPREVKIRTIHSGISAGTELTAFRGTNPYLGLEWDPQRRLFVEGDATLSFPIDGSGYEEVGEIAEVGAEVNAVVPGVIVWGGWGHRSYAVRSAEWAADHVLPDDADPVIGIFAKIGAIALNALLDADVHVGETVVVFGLGVPGQLVAQLARLNGAQVITVDGIEFRRETSLGLGAKESLDPNSNVAERVRELTSGRGADVCIEMSGSHFALHEAIRTAAYNSRVVVSGFFQGDAIGLRLGNEFHHNRIKVVASQISGVRPSLSHRWNELRMSRTILELAMCGELRIRELITHSIPVAEAPRAFDLLDHTPDQALQVVLDFNPH